MVRKVIRRKQQLDDTGIVQMCRVYKELRGHVKEANDECVKIRERIAPWIKAKGKPQRIRDGRIWHTITWIQPKVEVLDTDGLEAELSDDLWRACHELVFSNERLEDLVARGIIPAELVQKHITVESTTPYPKIQ